MEVRILPITCENPKCKTTLFDFLHAEHTRDLEGEELVSEIDILVDSWSPSESICPACKECGVLGDTLLDIPQTVLDDLEVYDESEL